MDYRFREIEKKWQEYWAKNKTFRTPEKSEKPKFYVLDMFPYPSGAGLHVGHPLGYIATDIVARFKRHKGFNVLHPMGYDSFGLPAEQYAIQTGQHPAVTTEQNINRYREQMDKLGFSFDWDREVRTSDPAFYKWTQWIFIRLFNSWYNSKTDKAEDIATLIAEFGKNGNGQINAVCDEDVKSFSATEWNAFSEKEKSDILMQYRLAFLGEAFVNWCPALGTVLANDEVKDGVSERGGYPVERKLMKQWSMRITAYAQRLLDGLERIDWPESLKESQRYWIGRSEGASVHFKLQDRSDEIEVFTTRPDTIFGVSFLVIAPEHDLINKITSPAQKAEIEKYLIASKMRSELDRQADINKVSGVFTGAYALHPFTGKSIPVWTGDYVLAGYGTGAVMAVPGHDARDYAFAKHFSLPIPEVVKGGDLIKESYDAKEGTLINSDFLDGLEVKVAIKKAISEIEKKGIGRGKVNFRLRDAVFGRQRYWGEPIPVYYKEGIPHVLSDSELPLVLPQIDKYLPTEDGEPPLARAAATWKYQGKYEYEWTTMPGWAGSSWYFLRYMEPHSDQSFAGRAALGYWKNVDLYIGGSEHATGHLLYVRFWTKFLFDLGLIPKDEPAEKLINQGMIQGISKLYQEVRIISSLRDKYINKEKELHVFIKDKIEKTIEIPIPPLVNGIRDASGHVVYLSYGSKLRCKFYDKESSSYIPTELDIGRATADFTNEKTINGVVYYNHTLLDGWLKVQQHYRPIVITDIPFNAYWDFRNKEWRDFDGEIVDQTLPVWNLMAEVEKMSKSKLNVVTPDTHEYKPTDPKDKTNYYFPEDQSRFVVPGIIEKFGCDTLRLYEMFLGPLEQSKPWNTNGITGVSGFLKKLWRLYHAQGEFALSSEAATAEELRILHRTIKKISEDIERFSFNTSVSAFMICVNELTEIKCSKRAVLEPLCVMISPFAPHIAEELWQKCGHSESIEYAPFPQFDPKYLVESSFAYPISFNGKVKFNVELPANLGVPEIEKEVMNRAEVKNHLNGAVPKKIIVVPKKIVNIVV
jgi:leucyl-tRNA synthetase